MKINSVCAIFVCYFPDYVQLTRAIGAMRPQVGAMILIDNGVDPQVRQWLEDEDERGGITHIVMETNVGVAAGQNIGISWASQRGFSHVLIMDQDSVAALDMVQRLMSSLTALVSSGTKVGAIGPKLQYMNTVESFHFIRLGLTGNLVCLPSDQSEPVLVDIIISSGSLIPLDVINAVGGMDESLFVDNVDVEWCFRAASFGFKLYGDVGAVMEHNLGDRVKRFWFLCWQEVVVHKPLRLYFIMRNRVRLYSRSYTPTLWVMQDLIRICAKFLIFTIVVPPRRRHFAMMLRGLWDGLAGRGGGYQPVTRHEENDRPLR
ncbi:MAG: glycosyltransferase family 2 protein [Pseudomonadota bacterium]